MVTCKYFNQEQNKEYNKADFVSKLIFTQLNEWVTVGDKFLFQLELYIMCKGIQVMLN